jgi:hypothetical protein
LNRAASAKLRDEFAKKAEREASALESIRQAVEKKLAQMPDLHE